VIFKIYSRYYSKVRTIGLLIALLSLGMTGTSVAGSIERGQKLFDSKCSFCHNANNTDTIVGPGLKDVLKNPRLPVSKRPSTPENIRRQLKKPVSRMPSFEFLTEEEVKDIISFLSTL
jgi:mono/diheme cytochrome c family protein